jgi:hypothetical protein
VALTQILPTFGSIFLNLNEKIVGVDCMMRWLSSELHVVGMAKRKEEPAVCWNVYKQLQSRCYRHVINMIYKFILIFSMFSIVISVIYFARLKTILLQHSVCK